MKIYLCGAINGCTDGEAKDWRELMKSYTQSEFKMIQYLDPMRRDYRGKEAGCYREIVDLDKKDVRDSDVIVVNYDKPSVGTSMEVFYAWTLGKPIVVWCKPDAVISPWLRYHSTCIVHTLEDAIDKATLYS